MAVVHPGFEKTAAEELRSLGVTGMTRLIEGGVEFGSDPAWSLSVNRQSRCVTRVLMRIRKFNAHRFDMLQNKIAALPWELFITGREPVSFQVASRKSKLYHTGRIEEELAAGITRRCKKMGIEPFFEDSGENQHRQRVFFRIEHNRCQVSIDTTGEPLYRRGEKIHVTDASIRETLAACILREAKIWGYDTVFDPMCGSGTFILEASGILDGRPPAAGRTFPMEQWPLYREMKEESAPAEIPKSACPARGSRFFASDIDSRALAAAERNFLNAGIAGRVSLGKRDFFTEPVPELNSPGTLLVINPPYGRRIGGIDTERIYRKTGAAIREFYPRCGYAVIVPGLELEKVLSLPHDRKILFMNGGIKVAAIIRDRS